MPILCSDMVRFNMAFQKSKVQLAPPTKYIDGIYDGCTNSKNGYGNWAFPIVHYFKQKLDFVSNILSGIEVSQKSLVI